MTAHRVAVAWSGGRDSTALLHATVVAAAGQGIEVVALHVHHGLSSHADAWLAHCEALCRRWHRRGLPVRLRAERLSERPGRGASVEAWAREQRYRALRRMALEEGATLVLLAHHRRDQAETLLLQALRGGGVAGLAGMPRSATREGITWVRPWLDCPRESIEAYVRRHRLQHIDDESNADPRFARNRLRLNVWPALLAAFPQAEATLADSARWARQAAACADELAAADLAVIERGAGAIAIDGVLTLPPHRRSNALRFWLRTAHGVSAPASLLTRLETELGARGNLRWPLPDGELRSHRGTLRHVAGGTPTPSLPAPEVQLQVKRAGRYALPGWGGTLEVRRVRRDGVPLAWLAHLDLRAREGAEQFQAGLGRPPRSLKKQYQAAGVAAWCRNGPLVYSGGQLVFVPGLGLDARVIGLPGQAQAHLVWVPDT